ncbi:hypothetical protein D9756_010095 [Leucocoprinus leucothites]|uniref:Glutamine amidotransferase domain-containing protein n=1 Tax=Leucocoprinus leucothites TaxID=201217 RepID=A0A8H5FR50_9AGAR|nr:hypothetical protein D9756_010095 [Leucoagaricus leucothites]
MPSHTQILNLGINEMKSASSMEHEQKQAFPQIVYFGLSRGVSGEEHPQPIVLLQFWYLTMPIRAAAKAKNRKVRIALLCCGEFTGKLLKDNGDYLAFHTRWLRKSLPKNSKVKPKVDAYKVYTEDHPLPTDEEIDDYDAILVSGSPSDAWADEPAWIPRLVDFIRKVGTNYPEVRIFAICFGHQIVNRALGGTVDGSREKPWEIGPTQVNTTYMGKILYGKEKLELQQFHQDHVPLESLTEFLITGDIYLVASSADYPNHGIVQFYPLDPNADPNAEFNLHERIHILTSQGHPEYTQKIVTEMARQREEKHTIPQKTVDDYFGPNGRNAEEKPMVLSGTGRRWARDYDGVIVIGHAFWKMFGVKYPDEEEEEDEDQE